MGPKINLDSVWEETHDFGKLRFYRPQLCNSVILLYVHGGGFVFCSIASHDALCRLIAEETKFLVVSLEYRLAPEHIIPAPQQDVLGAYKHLLKVGPELFPGASEVLVGVGGDSAGGNLSTSLCLQLIMGREGKEAPFPHNSSCVASLDTLAALPQPDFQVLVYPAVDLTSSTPSHTRYAKGWLLSAALREYFWLHYLGPEGEGREALKHHPFISPLLGSEEYIKSLCPAFVLTAEHDILRDEGVLYVEKLTRCGVFVSHVEALGLFHGFATSTELATGVMAIKGLCAKLSAWFRDRKEKGALEY